MQNIKLFDKNKRNKILRTTKLELNYYNCINSDVSSPVAFQQEIGAFLLSVQMLEMQVKQFALTRKTVKHEPEELALRQERNLKSRRGGQVPGGAGPAQHQPASCSGALLGAVLTGADNAGGQSSCPSPCKEATLLPRAKRL